MLEQVLRLMHRSPHHRGYSVDTVLRCILPPLELGQHTWVARGGEITAWASWAWLTEPVAEAFLHDDYKLRPDDWCSGDTLVFMDFIAPKNPGERGDALALYQQLRDTFRHIPARDLPGAAWVRFAKQGKIVRVRNTETACF